MTSAKATAIRNEIRRLQKEVSEFRARRRELLVDDQSGSLSSGGGSRSYTNWTPEKLDAAIAKDLSDIAKLKRALAGRPALRIGHAKVRRI